MLIVFFPMLLQDDTRWGQWRHMVPSSSSSQQQEEDDDDINVIVIFLIIEKINDG